MVRGGRLPELKRQDRLYYVKAAPFTMRRYGPDCCRDCPNPRDVKADGSLYSLCNPCRLKDNKRHKDTWNTTEGRKRIEEYQASEAFAKVKKRYEKSDKGKASQRRRNKVQVAKGNVKRWNQSEKGRANRQRSLQTLFERRRADANFAERARVKSLLSNCVTTTESSPLLVQKTEFTSPSDLREHLWNSRSGAMLTWTKQFFWSNYGVLWEIDHVIPREAYDHTDEEDRRHCHSHANVRALLCAENKEKRDHINQELCILVDSSRWPKWFCGKIPDEDTVKNFQGSVRCWKDLLHATD